MYYKNILYYPDTFEGGGGGSTEGDSGSTGSEEGETGGGGGGGIYGGNGGSSGGNNYMNDDEKKKKRKIITTITSDGNITINPGVQEEGVKLYKTISCPCSSYAILSSDGNTGCERDNFGKKEYIQPIILRNHVIENSTPKVGDKWRCSGNIRCNQGGFKWNTLHVVSVEENFGEISSSFINSNSSTSNCYIPSSTLKDYIEGENNYLDIDPIMLKNIKDNQQLDLEVKETINDNPIFQDKESASLYNFIRNNNFEVSEYSKDGITKYIPGKHYPNQKLITSCQINGKDMFEEMALHNWSQNTSLSKCNKHILKHTNDSIRIKILGENNPGITLTIKDSSGCDIIKKKIKNQETNNEYIFEQKIPSIKNRESENKTHETYEVTITPDADVQYYSTVFGVGEYIQVGIIKWKLYQLKNPTITFNSAWTTSISNTSTALDSDLSIVGSPNTYSANLPGFSKKTYEVTLSRSDGGTNNYYVSKNALLLPDLLSPSSVDIVTKIVDQVDEKELECRGSFKIDPYDYNSGRVLHTFAIEEGKDSSSSTASQIETGMKFTGKVEKTKTIRKLVDLDIHKEPCYNCDRDYDQEILTNKFELDDTNDLFSGMVVTGQDVRGIDFYTSLVSMDCDKSITLESEYMLTKNTNLTFTHVEASHVTSVKDDQIFCDKCIRLPKFTELTFTKCDKSTINGNISVSYSGYKTTTITTTIDNVYFGQENVTFSLSLDKFISKTPNAYDQKVFTTKERAVNINYSKPDADYNKHSKTYTVTKQPSNGTLSTTTSSKSSGTVSYYTTYTPNNGFTGKDTIGFTAGDGVNTSGEKTIYITIE